MSSAARAAILRWLMLALAVLVLNAALTFHNRWPTLWVVVPLELSIELAALLLGLVLCAAFGRIPGRRTLLVLTAVAVLWVLGRYLDVTAPALYGRPVNLYWDAPHLPNVAAMLIELAPWWLVLALVVGSAVLLATLAGVLHWCLSRVRAALAMRAQRRALGVAASAAVVLYALGTAFEWPLRWYYSIPVATAYAQQASFLLDVYAADSAGELPIAPLPESDLGRVAGADVLLLFLESYGAATYDMAGIEPTVAPARAEFQAAATANGQHVLSAFVTSPTFGGASWLAHSSLMSGFEVRDPGSYAKLLTQQRDTLPKLFKAHGYRAIALMPGLKNAWPEGVFYGFDSIYGEREINYRGPAFGWWRIPDQYSLAALDMLEAARSERKPLFVFLPTINTHIPFLPRPPYQPDWARLSTPDPFDAEAVAASNAQAPDWEDLGGPYAESFAYTFRYLAGYLRERADRDVMLVLLGDHQPAASVSGLGARSEVPVHIVTQRDDIADTLLDAGFIRGTELNPMQPSLGVMPELTRLLLYAFDSGATAGYASR
jgi:hypothetical protein